MAKPASVAHPIEIAVMAAIAAVIWTLDQEWRLLAPDVLVVLVVLPLGWVLSRKYPVQESGHASAVNSNFALCGAALLIAGIFTLKMTLMAFGWGLLASALIFNRSRISPWRLALLSAGAFPWVLLDFSELGWFFRLSGADATAVIYQLAGYSVQSDGTYVKVNDLLISVEAACSGMELLQVLISGGVGLSLIQYPIRRQFWLMVLLLPALAWISNTVRILSITFWALQFGTDAASGAFHTWGALVVMATMLMLYLMTARLLERLLEQFPKGSKV